MLRPDFTEALKLLKTLFGDVYSGEQMLLLWPHAAHLGRGQLEQVFRDIAKGHESGARAPNFGAVYRAVAAEAALALREAKRKTNSELTYAVEKCPRCFNTGIVDTVARAVPHNEVSFRCPCGAAERRGDVARDMRGWRSEYDADYVWARTNGEAMRIIAPACSCARCLEIAPRGAGREC